MSGPRVVETICARLTEGFPPVACDDNQYILSTNAYSKGVTMVVTYWPTNYIRGPATHVSPQNN